MYHLFKQHDGGHMGAQQMRYRLASKGPIQDVELPA